MGHAVRADSLPADQIRIADWHIASKLPLPLLVAGVGALGGAFALSGDLRRFYFSYLTAFMYGLTIVLGCLFFVLIQYAARAGWSVVVRRIAEGVIYAVPLFIVLFVPLYLGRHELYEWTHADVVAKDPILSAKAGYFSEPFWLGRAVVYLLGWSAIAHYFVRGSRRQDEEGGVSITQQLQKMSYPALMFFALSLTFAAIDWNKSLSPHWFSTMWGVYQFAGAIVAAYATISLLTLFFLATGLLRGVVTEEHRHDLGKLTFAFTVFWTYISFGQYFLIWYANIPEETIWYHHRMGSSWETLGITLMVGHFAVPFFFLMSRHVKRSMVGLTIGASWMMLMHYLDVYYQVMPSVDDHAVHFQLVDLLNVVGIVSLVLAVAFWAMRQAPLVPIRDPRLNESLAFVNL